MMENKPQVQRENQTISITIDGRQVRLSFSTQNNPELPRLIRNTLLDSFLHRRRIAEKNSKT